MSAVENVVQFSKKRPLPGETKEQGAPKKRKGAENVANHAIPIPAPPIRLGMEEAPPPPPALPEEKKSKMEIPDKPGGHDSSNSDSMDEDDITHVHYLEWTDEDFVSWFNQTFEFADKYTDVIKQCGLDGSMLDELSEDSLEDLHEIGISDVSHCKDIIDAIKQLKIKSKDIKRRHLKRRQAKAQSDSESDSESSEDSGSEGTDSESDSQESSGYSSSEDEKSDGANKTSSKRLRNLARELAEKHQRGAQSQADFVRRQKNLNTNKLHPESLSDIGSVADLKTDFSKIDQNASPDLVERVKQLEKEAFEYTTKLVSQEQLVNAKSQENRVLEYDMERLRKDLDKVKTQIRAVKKRKHDMESVCNQLPRSFRRRFRVPLALLSSSTYRKQRETEYISEALQCMQLLNQRYGMDPNTIQFRVSITGEESVTTGTSVAPDLPMTGGAMIGQGLGGMRVGGAPPPPPMAGQILPVQHVQHVEVKQDDVSTVSAFSPASASSSTEKNDGHSHDENEPKEKGDSDNDDGGVVKEDTTGSDKESSAQPSSSSAQTVVEGTVSESPLPIPETPPAGRAQGPASPHGMPNYQPSFGHFLPTQYPGMTHFYRSYAPQVYPMQPTPMFPDGRAYPRHGEGVVPPPPISAPPILAHPNSSGSSASSSTFSAFSPSGTNPNAQLRYEIPASFYQLNSSHNESHGPQNHQPAERIPANSSSVGSDDGMGDAQATESQSSASQMEHMSSGGSQSQQSGGDGEV